MSQAPAVYAAINAIQAELSKIGIEKARKNKDQGYSFRGIEDVYASLGPLLAQHRLVVLPRVTSRVETQRTTKSGTSMFNVAIQADFDLVSSVDGSKHTVSTFGEGMDTSDKATNKAMSGAYKYFAFLTFCVPVIGQDDGDYETPGDSGGRAPADRQPEGGGQVIDTFKKKLKDAPDAPTVVAISKEAKKACGKDVAAWEELRAFATECKAVFGATTAKFTRNEEASE